MSSQMDGFLRTRFYPRCLNEAMSDLDFDGFEEWFYHDIEKAFSADIACCDRCYADFLAMWPHLLRFRNGSVCPQTGGLFSVD